MNDRHSAFHLLLKNPRFTAIVALSRGLEILKLEPSGLGLRSKNRAEKQVLAWWLRQRTAVSRR